MNRLFRSYLFVFLRSSLTWFFVAGLVLFVAIVMYSFYFILPLFSPDAFYQMEDTLSFPSMLFYVNFTILFNFSLVLGFFYCSMISGNEYIWHTIRVPLLLGHPRWKIVLSKYLAIMVIIFLATLIALITAALVGLIGVKHINFPVLPISTKVVWLTMRTFLIGMFGIAAYMALTMAISTSTRSPLFGFSISLLIFFIEKFFSSMIMPVPQFAKYSLHFNYFNLVLVPEGYSYPAFHWPMLIALCFYWLLFLLWMILSFQYQRINE